MPTRAGLPQLLQTTIRLAIWIGASRSMIPAGCCGDVARWCFLIMFTPVTIARPSLGWTSRTWPVLPLSLPAITRTLSFFFNLFIFCASRCPCSAALDHFRGERDDLHEVTFAQLAGHRAEDAGAARVLLVREDHRRVLVEANVRSVPAAVGLGDAHHHRSDHIALLHGGVRLRLLHRGNDDVAHARIAPARAAGHEDAHDLLRAGVVGYFEPRVLLDHRAFLVGGTRRVPGLLAAWRAVDYSVCRPSSEASIACGCSSATLPRVRISATRQRFSFESGRVSTMRTMSPSTQALVSSCAL